MRNFLSLIMVLLTGMLLLACDNPVTVQEIHVTDTVKVSDTLKVPDTSKAIDTTKPIQKALTCLDAKTGYIPKGTFAKRMNTLQIAAVDSNGCFSFPTTETAARVAGRIFNAPDSVIFYNDSALFSVTIPYLNNGDTIQVVPTLVSLQKVPNSEIDSAFLVVYDRAHPQIQRKVKLKRTNYGSSSDYSRTLWSVDGSIFQVHFAVTNKAKVNLASSVIESEAGGMVFRLYTDISNTYGPRLIGLRDTLYIQRSVDTLVNNSKHNLDTLTNKFHFVGGVKLKPESIYGISRVLVDGVESDSIPPSKDNATVEHIVTMVDSAGYVTNAKVLTMNAEFIAVGWIYGECSEACYQLKAYDSEWNMLWWTATKP